MDLLRFLRAFRREPVADSTLTDALREKYAAFQGLLKDNNNVLMLMADMEEKLSGGHIFDRSYIENTAGQVSDGVLKIIHNINKISNNRYSSLLGIYDSIKSDIDEAHSHRIRIPEGPLAIPLNALSKEMAGVAGGKMAHLGEVKNILCLPTPRGFSITACAFKRFMEHGGVLGIVKDKVSSVGVDDLRGLERLSEEMRGIITSAPVSEALSEAVGSAYQEMSSGGSGPRVSVRSSAIFEDGEFSFAGQYATFLNVSGQDILSRYKEVVASLFTPRALFYCKTKGFSEEDLVMAVGIVEMVDARAAGVLYTKDPNNPERDVVIINAARGLGQQVVEGTLEPEKFVLSKSDGSVVEESVPEQKKMLVCSPSGELMEADVPESLWGKPCLSEVEARKLLEYAVLLERHYGTPQDVEWAVDSEGRIFVLQSRPLRMSPGNKTGAIPVRFKGRNILIDSGVIASKGIACGKAFILRDDDDLADFPEGAVLIARHTSTRYVTVMKKASAIITDVGSATGHMASLAREYRVPAIVDAGNATVSIKNGSEITVDAINCNVYEGRVEELLKHAASAKKDSFRGTRLFSTLESVLRLITPLNLVDPDDANFTAASCRTLHDMTRFAHEMSMREIFKTGKGESVESFEDLMSAIAFAESGEARLAPSTCALRAGIPVDAHLLDIKGGLTRHAGKVLPEDVSSIPFRAFLKGMKGMKWPGPPPVDMGGFLGMIARTASIPEDELQRMGSRSYAIISLNYMNFSIRLGYHFSMVEAYAGENMNDNYINFFFKGGGAVLDRRLRRVRLIREIIKRLGFKVKVTEDVIDAKLAKYRMSDIEAFLEAMGKLTAYTKQLDMALYNDSVTDMFIEDFVRDHMKGSSAVS